jgi:hypothetical protein
MTQSVNPFDVLRLLNTSSPCKKPKVFTAPTKPKPKLCELSESEDDSTTSLDDSLKELEVSGGKRVRFDLSKTQVFYVERRNVSREEKKERRKASKLEYKAKKQNRMKGF